MTLRATVSHYISAGGCVELEDIDFDHCSIVDSKTATLNQLRPRAAKRLRAIADQLEADAKHKRRAGGYVETFPEST